MSKRKLVVLTYPSVYISATQVPTEKWILHMELDGTNIITKKPSKLHCVICGNKEYNSAMEALEAGYHSANLLGYDIQHLGTETIYEEYSHFTTELFSEMLDRQ